MPPHDRRSSVRYPAPSEVPLGKRFDVSTHLLAREFERRGHRVEWLTPAAFLTAIGDRELGFWGTRSPLSNTFAERACTRKDVTRQLLERVDVPVAVGAGFRLHQEDAAREFAASLGRYVVKPSNAQKGRGLTVGITTSDEFDDAWKLATERPGTPSVLIESHFTGTEARFVVVGGRCVAVGGRRPPHVIGDGEATIEDLVGRKNDDRRMSPNLRHKPLTMTPARLRRLHAQGLELTSVLAPGEFLELDTSGNVSTGAEAVDLTDDVHPGYHQIAQRAAAAMRGLAVAGVDIMARDFTFPPDADNHIVVEVNSHPGIGAHHFPTQGEPRDVAGAIVTDTVARISSTTGHPPTLLSRLRGPDDRRDPTRARSRVRRRRGMRPREL